MHRALALREKLLPLLVELRALRLDEFDVAAHAVLLVPQVGQALLHLLHVRLICGHDEDATAQTSGHDEDATVQTPGRD